jgi:hypothetical protein
MYPLARDYMTEEPIFLRSAPDILERLSDLAEDGMRLHGIRALRRYLGCSSYSLPTYFSAGLDFENLYVFELPIQSLINLLHYFSANASNV